MRKLPLIIKENWDTKETEIAGLCRNFHSITLDNVRIHNDKLAKVFGRIGSQVRVLELDTVLIDHGSFEGILSSCPMLEKLLVSKSLISDEAAKDISRSSVKTLKSFIMNDSSWEFFDFLTASDTQVREMKIAFRNCGEAGQKTFENFLSYQAILDTLAVRVRHGTVYKSLAKFKELNYRFKLKKLAVDFKYWGDDPSVDDAFIAFLTQHQSTLEDLETQQNLSEKIFEHIVKHLHLQRLIVDATALPTVPLFYNSIRPNKNLKALIIQGSLNHLDVACGLMNVFPCVNKMIIHNWDLEIINDVIVFISNHLKHLHFLEIPNLTDDTPELAIPSLKTFHVDFVSDVTQWQTFLMNNPSIEKLVVQWLTNKDTFTYEIMDAITSRLQNLKQVKFGAYFKPTSRILEMMSRNCRSLERFEVLNDDPEDLKRNPIVNVGHCKVVYYPREAVTTVFKEEPSMWAEEVDMDINSDDSYVSGSEDDDDELMDWDEEDDYDDYDGDFDFHDPGYLFIGAYPFFN